MSTAWRLLRLLAPLRGWMALAVMLSACALVSGVALTAIASYLIAKAAVVDDVAALSIAFAAVRGFAVARAGFRYLERFVSHSLTLRVLVRLRTWFFAAVEPLAPAALTRYRSGDLLARAVADVQTLEGFYIRVVVPPLAAALAIAAVAMLLGIFSWTLALVLVASLLATGIFLPTVATRLAHQASADLIVARAELHAAMVDEVRGIADLLILDTAGRQDERLKQLSSRVDGAQQRLARVRGLSNGLTVLITALAALAVLWLAIPLVSAGQVDGVYLAMLVLVSVASFEAVQGMPAAWQQLQESRAAGQRIFELADSPAPVQEPDQPSPTPAGFGFELRDVCFSYSSHAPRVLHNLSFAVATGKKLAIVGASGCGKTTIVNLLLRFWEYNGGQVLLGGRDLRQYDAEVLRSYLGVVPQDVHLFNGTIRDNLQVANPDATQAQMDVACRQAVLNGFVDSLPDGYDTFVGEDGLLLSSGERQRLAIARMLLKETPFVILDEPTANLDAETELELIDRLRPALAGKTALIISHRPAVCVLADEVIELERGSVSKRPAATP